MKSAAAMDANTKEKRADTEDALEVVGAGVISETLAPSDVASALKVVKLNFELLMTSVLAAKSVVSVVMSAAAKEPVVPEPPVLPSRVVFAEV